MVAHTAAKSLLFSSAAGIEAAVGSDDLEKLRGMGRLTPWSGAGLAVGAVTLAGLPPTAGFVSEWFLLESLMQQFRVTALGGRLTLALAGAAVALTAGFAGVTFVRIVGMVVLGPRPPGRPADGDYGWPGRIALAVLAACPLVIAALTPLEIRVIAAGLSPAVPAGLTIGALKSPWVLQPVFHGFSILSPYLAVDRDPGRCWSSSPCSRSACPVGRMLRVRRVPAWRSATIGVEGADSYTAFGYANPTRRVLASVLHTRADLRSSPPRATARPRAAGPARRTFGTSRMSVEVVESLLYRPAARLFAAMVTAARRLQSGRLDAYLLYMLIALVAIVAVVTALH